MRSPTWTPPTPARVRRIRDRLRKVYGIPLMAPHGDPIAELVLTVLSQSTNDRNRDVAYLRLRERFTTWEDVRDAPVAAVEEAIRPGGISKVKSARIKMILLSIAERPGGDTGVRSRQCSRRGGGHPRRVRASAHRAVAALAARGPDRAGARLPDRAPRRRPQDGGVCAAVRLRAARRARRHARLARGHAPGPVPPGAPFEELHDEMLALTPPGEELELHVNLLRHGRRTCHARKPACRECALARMCPSRRL